MKTWQHIKVNPVAGALGAEVDGVALAQLSDAACAEVRGLSSNIRSCSSATKTSRATSRKPSLAALAHCTFIRLSNNSRTKAILKLSCSRATSVSRLSWECGTPTRPF
jgi:hypothetical protein